MGELYELEKGNAVGLRELLKKLKGNGKNQKGSTGLHSESFHSGPAGKAYVENNARGRRKGHNGPGEQKERR